MAAALRAKEKNLDRVLHFTQQLEKAGEELAQSVLQYEQAVANEQTLQKDMEELEKAMWSMKSRKAGREGDVPAEVWKMVFCNRMVSERRTGRIPPIRGSHSLSQWLHHVVLRPPARRWRIPYWPPWLPLSRT